MRAIKRVAGAVWAAFDLRDVFAFGGLGLVAWGTYLMHEPAAFIVTGAVLFWLGAIRSAGVTRNHKGR